MYRQNTTFQIECRFEIRVGPVCGGNKDGGSVFCNSACNVPNLNFMFFSFETLSKETFFAVLIQFVLN